MHHWNYGPHWSGGFPPLIIIGGILLLIMWGLLIWLIIYAIRKLSQKNLNDGSRDPAITILRERYSKGEVSTEEYRDRLKELRDTPN